jgi:hypothetical protein
MPALTRAEIAAAIAGVPGVTPTPDRPPSLDAGAAWPVWRSETPVQGGCAAELRWYVLVVGPNGSEGATVEAADPMLAPLVAALRGIGLVIETVEPVRLPVEPGGSAVPALRVAIVDNVWTG